MTMETQFISFPLSAKKNVIMYSPSYSEQAVKSESKTGNLRAGIQEIYCISVSALCVWLVEDLQQSHSSDSKLSLVDKFPSVGLFWNMNLVGVKEMQPGVNM